MLLKNRTAVITGCNKGIGKKTLEVFSKNGADVFACCRTQNPTFKKYINNLKKKYNTKITLFNLDLEDMENVKSCAKKILDKKKNVDILVNNAATIESSLFQMTTLEDLKKIFQINYFAQTVFTQIILKKIVRSKNGSVIYISSSSAIDGNIGRNAYSSSKASVISQAKTLSREMGRLKVRVNTIAPGLTQTKLMEKNTSQKTIQEVIQTLSLKRVGLPEEIANVALFLASDLSSYITGQTLRVDGGM